MNRKFHILLIVISFIILFLILPVYTADIIEEAESWEKGRYEDIYKQRDVPVYKYKVIKQYNHNESYFTEGFVFDKGILYESTGLWNKSKLVKYNIITGKVIKESKLRPKYFGEGITVIGDDIFQITYRSNTGFVYDKNTFKLKKTFSYPSEGWGLTTDGKSLIMSNGSSSLIFLDPVTFKVKKYVKVLDKTGQVGNLNELEYIKGNIYANIWHTDLIAIISPDTGAVTGWIDLTGINPDKDKTDDSFVLNGIAYNHKTGHILITGKCWPKIYEIELIR
ncbi:MAG: glutaminyl-peptide cyclotransferase [Armatimonadota bacterium]